MSTLDTATLGAALAIVAIHLFSGKLRFLRVIPRSRWLSAAGGVSVAYVFVHLIPEVAESQERLEDALFPWLESHAYLLALVGLTLFYAVELVVRRHRERGGAQEAVPAPVFWLHVGAFTVYNLLVGSLLVERSSLASLAWYALAIALHFLVADFGLREDHREQYARTARWLLTAGVVTGTALGFLVPVPPAVHAGLTAFLAGGIILNVLKEELPEGRESRLTPFLLGAAAYAGLLLVAG